jgi:membrane protein DedA with SNARE-associated domain
LLRVNGLQVFVDALLSFYGANELLGLFLFLFIEEAGVPLWFLPGDVLVMLAGSRPGRTPGSVAMILLAATAGVSIGSSLLYLVGRLVPGLRTPSWPNNRRCVSRAWPRTSTTLRS